MAERISKRTVDALQPGDRDLYLWDSGLAGFGVKRFPEAKRERFFSDEELRHIGQTLDEADRIISELPGCTAAIRLLALTGMRMGEVLGLRWSDVDLPNRATRLRDAKTGPRTVPLGAAAFELLGTLDQSDDYVVYGLNPSEPLAAYVLEKAWARLRIKAGVPDGRLHDFRHTAGTFAAQAGFNAFQIRDLLGHKTLAMTGRYVERATNPLRATADHFAGRVAMALNAKPASGDVVKFPAPRTQAG